MGDGEARRRRGAERAPARPALIDDIRSLITHVGDSSKLILDPDLDTYYVMDALLLKEPEIIDGLGDARAPWSTAGAGRPRAEPAAELAGARRPAALPGRRARGRLETAFAETPNFNENERARARALAAVARALDATSRGRRPHGAGRRPRRPRAPRCGRRSTPTARSGPSCSSRRTRCSSRGRAATSAGAGSRSRPCSSSLVAAAAPHAVGRPAHLPQRRRRRRRPPATWPAGDLGSRADGAQPRRGRRHGHVVQRDGREPRRARRAR